jgi:hypothetical protein
LNKEIVAIYITVIPPPTLRKQPRVIEAVSNTMIFQSCSKTQTIIKKNLVLDKKRRMKMILSKGCKDNMDNS